jgi:diguanylate cyclase (GGDEF)-like protein/PAS domain S-box-containing protein
MSDDRSTHAANPSAHCPVRIQLFETDEAHADRLEQLLSGGEAGDFQITRTNTLAKTLDALAQAVPDVILVGTIEARHDRLASFNELRTAAPEALILPLAGAVASDAAFEASLDEHWLAQTLRYITQRKTAESDLRTAEAILFEEKERAQVTLNSIGDAVLVTDARGYVTYLNPNGEHLTGWPLEEAVGRELGKVFPIINGASRRTARNPAKQAMDENQIVGLAANCVLLRRDGSEAGIEDSAAPIHDRDGRVTGAVIVFRDVSQSRTMTRKMAHLAKHDALTGLPNRVLLDEQLNQIIRLAKRHGQRVALLYVDLDNFKQINDTLGHVVGDQVLKAVAHRLRATVRGSDTVCRQGGDEFVILLSEIETPADASAIVRKLKDAFKEPILIDNHALNIEMSVGISINPDDGDSVDSLLAHADTAMYHAKHHSDREPAAHARAAGGQPTAVRSGVERDLHRALERGEFQLHYQPQFDLVSGKIVAIEALLRWWSPDHGLVYPDQFVPLAEQRRLIVPIGRWVLETACHQVREWQAAGLTPPRFAINVSGVELSDKRFPEGVAEVLRATGVEPDLIEIELTETALLEDIEGARRTLGTLSDMGLHLAIDDFGAGYSSLNYLRRLPVNTLKVDRSFLQNINPASSNTIILRSILALGRDLGHRVVAEGVERAWKPTRSWRSLSNCSAGSCRASGSVTPWRLMTPPSFSPGSRVLPSHPPIDAETQALPVSGIANVPQRRTTLCTAQSRAPVVLMMIVMTSAVQEGRHGRTAPARRERGPGRITMGPPTGPGCR